MKLSTIVIAAASLAALAACQPTNSGQRQANCVIGTAGGAALGAVLGNQVGQGMGRDVATIAGAAGGGLAGSQVLCQ
jgi:outer membrane lipoprotein SlyB